MQAVAELCNGNPTSLTEELMRGLANPLDDQLNPIRLYGTNFEVDLYNHQMLYHDANSKDITVYHANDSGMFSKWNPANIMTIVDCLNIMPKK